MEKPKGLACVANWRIHAAQSCLPFAPSLLLRVTLIIATVSRTHLYRLCADTPIRAATSWTDYPRSVTWRTASSLNPGE